MGKNCPKCGKNNTNKATFCMECGINLEYSELKSKENLVPLSTTLEHSLDEFTGSFKDKIEKFQNKGIDSLKEDWKDYRKKSRENKKRKLELDIKKKRQEFLEGTPQMILKVPIIGGSSTAVRTTATLVFGIVGYAATRGGGSREHKIKVKITDDELILSGVVNSNIDLSNITNTMMRHGNPRTRITINFNDGSSILLYPIPGLIQYADVLNEIIEERLKKINQQKTSTTVDKTSIMDEIKKAKELLDIGAITEEEYEEIKNKYLMQL